METLEKALSWMSTKSLNALRPFLRDARSFVFLAIGDPSPNRVANAMRLLDQIDQFLASKV